MNTKLNIIAIGCCFLIAVAAEAQRGGPGGDRGGDRGGGDRGGGMRGGGGAPGGDRGGRGGAGGPGGDRGGRGGGGGAGGTRGGFDPSGFLSRLDTNGNGILDPDEQKGPAQFMISRLQQSDPSIKAGQPISIKKVSESFTKMREQSSGDPRASRGNTSSTDDDSLEVELLVPGFGIEEEPMPLMGFGAAAEMLSVPITDADLAEAASTMQRYDRNKDGFIAKNELSSRFSGNPMDFDRNKDGKLSQKELAVRYARRREGREEATAQKDRSRRSDDRRRSDDDKEIDVYNGRKSYRMTNGKAVPEGTPGFFADKDANQDGQVTMAEFASDWNDGVVAEFFKSDLNKDGTITAAEALRAVEQGVSVSAPASTGSSSNAMASRSSSTSRSSGSSGSTSSGSSKPAAGSTKPDDKLVRYAERIIGRYDKNKDGALVASEWGSMLMNPAPADGNRDGRVTIEEYAIYLQSRSKKK
ncbi:EF-hand domain-containing protein [Planctomycetes bacterium K23_9]